MKKNIWNKMDRLFHYYILNDFCKKYDVSKDVVMSQPIYNFRLLCFKMNFFMKYIVLPKIQKNNLQEAVFIEFRNFPHVEFIIRNAILKLGTKWSHTVICGNLNYDLIKNICKDISKNIHIIKINVDNMNQSEYSKFLTTMEFWNLLEGEKILIYQEDSIIFKKNIQDFLQYDFIGAPFLKNTNDTPNSVGNGGLSLRSKSKMIEIITKFSPHDYKYNNSTLEYMASVKLEFPPEDVYFSKCMQEQTIGFVANWDDAYQFSSESVFNHDSFGGHKFWISNDKWSHHMKKTFYFKIYNAKSHLNKLLLLNRQPLSFNLTNQTMNAFDIDLYFFCKANNIPYINSNNAMIYFIKFALEGFIYHPKQLLNIYPDIMFYNFLDNIYVVHKLLTTPLYEFVGRNLYNSTFENMSNLLIDKKYSCLNNNYDILLLVFIGDEQIGIDLIHQIINYKQIQSDINVAFCFNENTIKELTSIKQLITDNFDFYAIYKCMECGSDIIPTLLMYNNITLSHKFKHIFKFHTKTNSAIYSNLTNFLLSKPLLQLINQYEDLSLSNCIGSPNSYINLHVDNFNDVLKKKYASIIDFNKSFVGGTIFYSSSIVFDNVLNFLKNTNYRAFMLNNLYENNLINKDYSPVHFLERLFGVMVIY